MEYILETKRLTLRHLSSDDTKFMVKLVNTPGWIEFIGNPKIKLTSREKTVFKNKSLESYELKGFGLFLAELKNTKTPIGMCGFIKRTSLENPDIGFAVLPEFAGKGLASEIAKATRAFADDKLLLPTIFAIPVSGNKTLMRLLERIGMKFS